MIQPVITSQVFETMRIEVGRLRPGDALIVRFREPVARDVMAEIRGLIEKNMPGVSALVCDNTVELQLATRRRSWREWVFECGPPVMFFIAALIYVLAAVLGGRHP